MPNHLLVGFGRHLLVPRCSLEISYLFSNSCDFLARTNMYVTKSNASMFERHKLDGQWSSLVTYLMNWKVIMLGYMRVISYILLNRLDQLEINASPNQALQHDLKKFHLPCQSLLFTHKNQGGEAHPMPQMVAVA